MKGSYTITSTAHHSVDVGVPVHVHLVEDVAEVAVGDSVILPRLLDCPACLLDILNDVLQSSHEDLRSSVASACRSNHQEFIQFHVVFSSSVLLQQLLKPIVHLAERKYF